MSARFAKPLLILLNPTAGKAQAVKLFRGKISAMLDEAEVKYEVIETSECGGVSDWQDHNHTLFRSGLPEHH